MPWRQHPLIEMLPAMLFASFAGVASLLRSRTQLDWRVVVGATINSGVVGAIVWLMLHERFRVGTDGEGAAVLYGICGLAGIGGANVLDILWQFCKGKIKLAVNIVSGDDKDRTP